MVTDASGTGIGAACEQLHGEEWVPIAYMSHKLTPAQRAMATPQRELLAIKTAICKWGDWLRGIKLHIITRAQNFP